MPVAFPPPLALKKLFSRSGCGRIFSLFSGVIRVELLTGTFPRWSESVLSGVARQKNRPFASKKPAHNFIKEREGHTASGFELCVFCMARPVSGPDRPCHDRPYRQPKMSFLGGAGSHGVCTSTDLPSSFAPFFRIVNVAKLFSFRSSMLCDMAPAAKSSVL